MPEPNPKVTELEERINRLVKTQINFEAEINAIRAQLFALRQEDEPDQTPMAEPPSNIRTEAHRKGISDPHTSGFTDSTSRTSISIIQQGSGEEESESSGSTGAFSDHVSSYAASARANLEKFIGENLISKIGIIILVLGVGIGTKYAIDNGWISPLMRIVSGYLFGVCLVALAVRLKVKYHNFSSVLLGGGMAIMYFVTYFAYAYYLLMPQSAAFALMAIFTVFTVSASIIYERQIIAHLGLVGAYAVPFLLSNDSGRYSFLFTYIAIVNLGILAIAVRQNWRSLFYTSSAFTWLIYFGWFVNKYSAPDHFYLALGFLAIFFLIFYAAKVAHGILYAELSDVENLTSIVATAVVFYSFCFAISDVRATVLQYAVLFSYLAIISLVILYTSFRFYGRLLVFVSYPFTWLIYGAWFSSKYNADEHFWLAGVFAVVFFGIYYGAALIYRLVTEDIGMIESASLVLTNSFVFYGFGYGIVDSRAELQSLHGLFTVAHGIFHSFVAQIVNRFRQGAVDVVQVLAVLIFTFATIAIPIQFDGNYVTLFWTAEAAYLFYFGRARHVRLFEYFSYPLMILATCSLFSDWLTAYDNRATTLIGQLPLANGMFITAAIVVAAFGFIYLINRDERFDPAIDTDLVRPFGYAVAVVGLFVLYNMFRVEISNYFHLQMLQAETFREDGYPVGSALSKSHPLSRFNWIWQLNYTMFFLSTLAAVNLRKVRSTVLASTGAGLSILVLMYFDTAGMLFFHELRESYMSVNEGFATGPMNFVIRYISYLFVAGLIYTLFEYSRDELLTERIQRNHLRLGFDAVLYLTVLIVSSCDLVNLMTQFNIPEAYKLGLSVLWGVYALTLIAIGIKWNKKHLRIGAMVLLGVTVAKLFLYDVSDLPTIPKTILFISLGILMLIVSFLYTKYKGVIFKPETGQQDVG
jgi:uncharacterized membrane protein